MGYLIFTKKKYDILLPGSGYVFRIRIRIQRDSNIDPDPEGLEYGSIYRSGTLIVSQSDVKKLEASNRFYSLV